MEPCPATPLLQLTSSDHDGTPAETGPIQVYASPEEGAEEAKKEEERVLSAMVKRKVVQWKEMEMGELCDTCGLGAVLKTMAVLADSDFTDLQALWQVEDRPLRVIRPV